MPRWLVEQPTLIRHTEITVPLVIGIAPAWPHPNGPGAWYAFITVDGFPGQLWECDHLHPTTPEAWVCAGTALRAQSGRTP